MAALDSGLLFQLRFHIARRPFAEHHGGAPFGAGERDIEPPAHGFIELRPVGFGEQHRRSGEPLETQDGIDEEFAFAPAGSTLGIEPPREAPHAATGLLLNRQYDLRYNNLIRSYS